MVSAFEGNKGAKTTPVIEAFVTAHRLPDVTVVADAGVVSDADQEEVEAAGGRETWVIPTRRGGAHLAWRCAAGGTAAASARSCAGLITAGQLSATLARSIGRPGPRPPCSRLPTPQRHGSRRVAVQRKCADTMCSWGDGNRGCLGLRWPRW